MVKPRVEEKEEKEAKVVRKEAKGAEEEESVGGASSIHPEGAQAAK